MGDRTKQSGIQRFLLGLFSPATAARMEADSRVWMVQCPNCGYERSIWEMGGIRYKSSGSSRSYMRCINCGKRSWHKIYRREGPPPEVTVAPDSNRRPRWLMWTALIGIVVAALAVLAIAPIAIFAFVNALLQPVVTAGDDFMAALKNGDYARAYTLCTPELQRDLVSQSGLAERVQSYRPIEWNWTSRSNRNGVGRLSGSFTYSDGKSGTVQLVLREVEGNWKLVSFSLNPTGYSPLKPHT